MRSVALPIRPDFDGFDSIDRVSKFSFAAFAAIGLLLSCTSAFGTEVSFKDFPFLIYCQSQGISHAFYFSKLDANGQAIYITPDRQAGTITLDSVGQRIGGDQSGSCANKTLDDLRSAGQAFDLRQSK
jgi:hypothetical protein